ncbi:hypothetical protein Ddye_023865 [Dipteronia dyeriana]|uniref:Pectinesterase catalytic domain-containing protein n=1 Tax=Dipteronia dyeriana TaxID=168575 RepID=A0AAD9TU84_9ROSI|nr:hypothetical protein Ddye_023865 [Dipteronia dyeriana]
MQQPTSNSIKSSLGSGSGNDGGGGGGDGGKSGKRWGTIRCVVAADGSRNFTNVTDAVLAAPNYSMKRYVIYIKRCVYKEYVDIKKKKWNLMMVRDGMNATIISGDRNFIDGWTTFRSAEKEKEQIRRKKKEKGKIRRKMKEEDDELGIDM